jgi:hypothetical protein
VLKFLGMLLLGGPLCAQIGVLRLGVVEGEGGVHPGGARSSGAITVQVTDETGSPVVGAAISFQLPESGPGGTFASGLRTDVVLADERGRASVRSLRLNRIPGPFEIRITAAKDQVRAGMISRQYIAATEIKGSGSKRKWMVLAAVAAGVAAGGVSARGGSPTAGSPGPSASQPAALTIGSPTITIQRP